MGFWRVTSYLFVVVVPWLALGSVGGQARADAPVESAPASYDASLWNEPFVPIFEQAAQDYDCPIELLLTLGQMGSRFTNRGSTPTIENGFGVMALRHNRWGADSLTLASTITGINVDRLKVDPVANIRGAAAVLNEYARQEDIDRNQGLEAWLPVVIRYAGLDTENSRFFAYELFKKIERGFSVTTSRGETIELEPTELSIVPASLVPFGVASSPVDYFGAIWDPAATCNYTASSTVKDTVVIHTAEGTAAGVRAWYKNCASQESTHYVVSEIGTVWQMVSENFIAWHDNCYNSRSIGITHEGYAASPDHPQNLYNGSAALCRNICNRWSIPKRHTFIEGPGIMGHIDVNTCCCVGNGVDPGSGWDWDYYLSQVFDAPAPTITAAVSRKEHGSAGFFDVDLFAASAVEPRQGGATVVVVTFDREIESVNGPNADDVMLSSGMVHHVSLNGDTLTIDMTGATDAAICTMTFPGIVSTEGIGIIDRLCFAVLEGDVNGDRSSSLFDMVDVRDAMDAELNGDNFIYDINADGLIDLLDMSRVRDHLDKVIVETCS